jgi:hypothetical protein
MRPMAGLRRSYRRISQTREASPHSSYRTFGPPQRELEAAELVQLPHSSDKTYVAVEVEFRRKRKLDYLLRLVGPVAQVWLPHYTANQVT